MMVTVFFLVVCSIIILIAFTLYSIRLYSKALEINPEKKSLDDLLNDIKVAEITKKSLTNEIGALEAEKSFAEEIIRKREEAEQFLSNHSEEVEKMRQEIEDLEQKYKDGLDKLGELKNSLIEQNEEKMNLKKEVEELEVKLVGINSQIAQAESEISELRGTKESIVDDIDELKEQKNSLDAEVKELEEKLKSLHEKEEEYARLLKNIQDSSESLARLRADIASSTIQSGETVDAQKLVEEKRWEDLDRPYITKKKEKGRKLNESKWLAEFKDNLAASNVLFPERTINAFHTGLKVADYSPLVVLAGISGTGKSLLPQLYAKASGMNFLSVAVQPRWDSPQDMFGFYNYMQNKFKATELSRLLWQYDFYNNPSVKESYGSFENLPMNLVLLDEMNLARVEYYFSDMLSKLEVRRTVSADIDASRRVAEVEIESGSISSKDLSRRLFVSKNNLFIGTMNEDETTQSLSDKVVDRSNVLRFGKPKELQSNADISLFEEKYEDLGYLSYGNWDGMKSSDVLSSVLSTKLYKITNDINNILASVDRPFAHRVWSSIENYVQSYPDVMYGNNFNCAIADQIEMKILPKLNGLEKDNPKVREALDAMSAQLDQIKDSELKEAFEAVKEDTSNVFFAWKGVTREVESK